MFGGRAGVEDVREDELALAEICRRGIELGAPVERVVGILQAMARSARHMVDLQRDFIDEVLLAPSIESSGSVVEALESTALRRFEFRDLGRRLAASLLERYVDEAVFENLVRLTELALTEGGVSTPFDGQPAVVFPTSAPTPGSPRIPAMPRRLTRRCCSPTSSRNGPNPSAGGW